MDGRRKTKNVEVFKKMKLLGLIGGTGWASTVDYYKYINEATHEKTGGKDFAECIIYSFNFTEIRMYVDKDDWDGILKLFTKAGNCLKNSGAEAIVLCANTAHLIAEKLEQNLGLPIIHIAKETAREVKKSGIKTAGLLGTKFTMERDFFKTRLMEQEINTVIPDEEDRVFVHTTILDEMTNNIFKDETREAYIKIINKLISKGAEGIIMGCTEIPLLLRNEKFEIPFFDTTKIHSQAAVNFALN
jgi:aspartate racemase